MGILKRGHTAQEGRGTQMIHVLYNKQNQKDVAQMRSQNKKRVGVTPVSCLVDVDTALVITGIRFNS